MLFRSLGNARNAKLYIDARKFERWLDAKNAEAEQLTTRRPPRSAA